MQTRFPPIALVMFLITGLTPFFSTAQPVMTDLLQSLMSAC